MVKIPFHIIPRPSHDSAPHNAQESHRETEDSKPTVRSLLRLSFPRRHPRLSSTSSHSGRHSPPSFMSRPLQARGPLTSEHISDMVPYHERPIPAYLIRPPPVVEPDSSEPSPDLASVIWDVETSDSPFAPSVTSSVYRPPSSKASIAHSPAFVDPMSSQISFSQLLGDKDVRPTPTPRTSQSLPTEYLIPKTKKEEEEAEQKYLRESKQFANEGTSILGRRPSILKRASDPLPLPPSRQPKSRMLGIEDTLGPQHRPRLVRFSHTNP
ncbi:uncharacterized protein JCM6883_001100 [Sporobolomyces salmoneus]|uniref:uncharacterized protein n=1 Tax=Sporobolomyces salmoneus TaxID=183962 RepID=UPI00316D4985